MKEFLLNGPEDYKVMCQEGVKQYVFPLEYSHNAIWDSNVSPEGKFYFGLASEIFTGNYVRLCEYDYEKNDIHVLFAVEDVILPSDRTIRASKFHTSISFMKDGKMIMTTHTTDKVPPIPHGCGSVLPPPVEGFPGSTSSLRSTKKHGIWVFGSPRVDTVPCTIGHHAYFHRLSKAISTDTLTKRGLPT